MDAALLRESWRRADGRCEYCQLSQEFDDRPFEIDHIRSRKHHGPTVGSNLALSCFRCNSFKGPNIGGIDDKTRSLTALFNPRRHKWARHFRWEGAYLIGRTSIGAGDGGCAQHQRSLSGRASRGADRGRRFTL